MNTRMIRSLLWEIVFRDKLRFLLLLAGSLLAVTVFNVGVDYFPNLSEFTHFLIGFYFLSGLYFVSAFSYAQFNQQTFESEFPAHLHRLPLSTRMLVALPLISGWLFLFGYSELWLAILPTDEATVTNHFSLLLVCGIAVSWFQSLSWGLNRSFLVSGPILVTVITLTVVCFTNTKPFSDTLIPYSVAYSGLIVILIIGCGVSYLAVKQARQGSSLSKKLSFSLSRFFVRTLTQPHQDGLTAQVWYESRLFGWMLPAFATAASIVMLVLLINATDPQNILQAIIMLCFSLIYLSGIAGFNFARSHPTNGDFSMMSFWATRPLSSVKLANAKLLMAFKSIVYSLSIFIGLMILSLLAASETSAVNQLWQSTINTIGWTDAISVIALAIILVSLLAWITCSLAMSVSLLGNKKINRIITMMFVVVMIGVFGISIQWNVTTWLKPLILQFGTVLIIVPGISAMIVLAVLSDHFKSLAPLSVLKKPVLSIIFLLSGLITFILVLNLPTAMTYLLLLIAATLTLLAALPLLAAPIALAKNRHVA
ncbi:hypothetical protein [Pleionea sediminis]|uniref:hypothetical protein n=1 Tax=Pleionea sediminis TaxID=2569479 RepID=UPI001186634B|nr:hypothetical protein [Pleionea sediminis]